MSEVTGIISDEYSDNRGRKYIVWQTESNIALTPAEALDILYRAATRDPYSGDVGQLVECRMVLERALGLEERECIILRQGRR